ncbi:MAG: peptidoglycan-binding protein [Hyphomicrobiaceae bacterium]|nr:MAG: peptidoglycan-binding protein [Hyphomicrobiaceae bacterium]
MSNTQQSEASAGNGGKPRIPTFLPRMVAVFVIGLSGAVAFNALVLQRGQMISSATRLDAIKPQETRESLRKAKAHEPKPISEVAATRVEAVSPRLASQAETDRRLELTVARLEELDPVTPELVKAIQRELMARGFDPGGADGQNGTLTRAAILSFEFEEGLPLSGEPTQALLRRLVLGATSEDAKPRTPQKSDAATLKLVKSVQNALASLQYAPGPADGALRAETVRVHGQYPAFRGERYSIVE